MTTDDVQRAEATVEEILGGTDEPEHSGDTPEKALPADQVAAMRYLRRLRTIVRQIENADEVYEAAIAELEEARTAHLDPLKATEEWLRQALALWHHARLAEDPEAKTVKLPTGTLSSSKADRRWTYDDEAAFLEWAREHAQGAVRPPKPGDESIDKTAAKAALGDLIEVRDGGRCFHQETGELIPGLLVNPGGDYGLGRFYKPQL